MRFVKNISARHAAGALLAAWGGLFVIHSLIGRRQWESERTVELCVDGLEVDLLADQIEPATYRLLEELQEKGVSSVGVFWDPSHSLREHMAAWEGKIPVGLSVTLRPEAAPFTDWPRGWDAHARLPVRGPPLRHVLFSGQAVLGFPDLNHVYSWLEENNLYLPIPEFQRPKGLGDIRRQFPHRVIRAHAVSEEEMAVLSAAQVKQRYLRAVRERGARFLYVRLFPGLAKQANVEFVSTLAGQLRARGFLLGPVAARGREWPSSLIPISDGVRGGGAFLIVAIIPFLAFFAALKQRSPYAAPGVAAGGAFLGGLCVAALLATPSYVLGISLFRGVKAGFLLPLLAGVLVLYRGDEWRHFLSETVTAGRLLVGLGVLGAVSYYVLRTGHGTVADASAWEMTLRGRLETLFGVRPRFKEFLIGHPMLWFGFYLRARLGSGEHFLPMGKGWRAQIFRFVFHDARPFLLAGMIGPLSVVNTFCHPHSPLGVSIARTFHGVWLGAALGGLLIWGFQLIEKNWKNFP